MIARLVIVTVALAAVALMLRLRGGRTAKTHQLRVTARTALHRGAVLLVVEIEGRRLLIGAGTQQIQLLTELEPVPDDGPVHRKPELPSELPAVPDDAATILERFRRATSRTLDPDLVARARARTEQEPVS